MDKEKANKILKDYIQPDNGLFCRGHYMAWSPGDKEVALDSDFDTEELQAIAWWIRNYDKKCHSKNHDIITTVSHKGFYGAVHYYDVADGYGATLVYHAPNESYHLEVPRRQTNEPLAKTFDDLKAQWIKLIDGFLERHPEIKNENN